MDRQLSAWLYCRIDAPEDVYGVLKKQKKSFMIMRIKRVLWWRVPLKICQMVLRLTGQVGRTSWRLSRREQWTCFLFTAFPA